MVEHERYGLEDFLIAASGAGRLGFSATQTALMNLARCSLCPFWHACEGANCQVLDPVETATPSQMTDHVDPSVHAN